jgi:hypothetical protein
MDLDHNQLVVLPASFDGAGMPNLQYLDLRQNQLVALPESFGLAMGKLTRLDLGENQLAALPAGAFGTGMGNLEHLDLSQNQLVALPEAFGSGIGKLQYLDVSHNPLTSLPALFGSQFHTLRTLYASNCSLISLPATFGSAMGSLQTLHLDQNMLASLPAAFGTGMGNMEHLNLDSNQLTSLPAWFSSGMRSVETLNLRSNSLPFDAVEKQSCCSPVFTWVSCGEIYINQESRLSMSSTKSGKPEKCKMRTDLETGTMCPDGWDVCPFNATCDGDCPESIDKPTEGFSCSCSCPFGQEQDCEEVCECECPTGSYTKADECIRCPDTTEDSGTYRAAKALVGVLAILAALSFVYSRMWPPILKLFAGPAVDVDVRFGLCEAGAPAARALGEQLVGHLECEPDRVRLEGASDLPTGERVTVLSDGARGYIVDQDVIDGPIDPQTERRPHQYTVKLDHENVRRKLTREELGEEPHMTESNTPAVVYVLTAEWLARPEFVGEITQLLSARARVDLDDHAADHAAVLDMPHAQLAGLRAGAFIVIAGELDREAPAYKLLTDEQTGLGLKPALSFDGVAPTELLDGVAAFVNGERLSPEYKAQRFDFYAAAQDANGFSERITGEKDAKLAQKLAQKLGQLQSFIAFLAVSLHEYTGQLASFGPT